MAWTTYVVPHSEGADDGLTLTKAFAANPQLATNTKILFKKGITYNILTPLLFPALENVIVSVQGNLSYGADIKATQEIVGSSAFSGHWFKFTGGSNVTLEGSRNPNWGWVNSHGQQWWDVMQDLASQVNRPKGWGFQKIINGEIRYMKLWQPIGASFSTAGSKGLHVHHNTIIAISENKAFPFNTDGFAAQGTDMLFEHNVIYNGDDCLTVGSPSSNIHFRNSYCNGGHGLSIGSLGKGGSVADVQNVLIENVTMENSLYGARFKSWTGGNGVARNITWKDITIRKVRFPIFVTQNYWDQAVGSKPNSATTNNTLIDTFLFQTFRGTIDDDPKYHEGTCVSDPCWYDVSGATGKEVAILDLYKGAAKNIVLEDISVTTLSGEPVTVICDPATINTNLGFKCWNGLFQPQQSVA